MIKKTTWVVLLCAVVLGAADYYFAHEKNSGLRDIPDLAFSIRASDINTLKFTHPGRPNEAAIRIVKRNNVWQIIQPVNTPADQAWVAGIADGIADAGIAQTEPIVNDRLKVYGLSPPQFSLQFQLQNGTTHTILIGDEDFLGTSVYSIVDGSKSVWLLPQSIWTSCDKTVYELRDRTVLNINSDHVISFRLRNHSGELLATKKNEGWRLSRPLRALADSGAVASLLSAVAEAKMSGVVSEEPKDLAQYGLDKPAITFTTFNYGHGSSTLLVGKQVDGDYFARDLSRPMTFRIDARLYKSLSANYEGFLAAPRTR